MEFSSAPLLSILKKERKSKSITSVAKKTSKLGEMF